MVVTDSEKLSDGDNAAARHSLPNDTDMSGGPLSAPDRADIAHRLDDKIQYRRFRRMAFYGGGGVAVALFLAAGVWAFSYGDRALTNTGVSVTVFLGPIIAFVSAASVVSLGLFRAVFNTRDDNLENTNKPNHMAEDGPLARLGWELMDTLKKYLSNKTGSF